MDVRIGTRYYRINRDGTIQPDLVFYLPFELPDNAFLQVEEAIAMAMPYLGRLRDESDSISEREIISSQLDRLKEAPAARARELEECTLYYLFHNSTTTTPEAAAPPIDEAALHAVSYVDPGTRVWFPVTPGTHGLDRYGPWWRPAVYFILTTTVEKVSWTRLGFRYTLDSRYTVPDKCHPCTSLDGAKAWLSELILEQAHAVADWNTMEVFSSDSEKSATKKMWHDLSQRADLRPQYAD